MIERVCRISGEKFVIEREDLEFYAKMGVITEEQFEKLASMQVGEFASMEAEKIPSELLIGLPTLCPEERQRRRMAWRNDRNLYQTKSFLTDKPLVSIYSEDKPYKVCSKAEFSDLSNTTFGRDFDFSRPFFEQFQDLYKSAYKVCTSTRGEIENSEYSHFTGYLKDCYLVFDSGKNEGCMYGNLFVYSKDSLDCYNVTESELCYESIDCNNCYELRYSSNCKNCSFSYFLSDCIGCKNCFGCKNLRNKEYYFLNKQLSRDEYEQKISELGLSNDENIVHMKPKFQEYLLQFPTRANRNINCQDSLGNNLTNCKNMKHSYDSIESENCKYCSTVIWNTSHSYDIDNFGENMSFCYELSGCGGALKKKAISDCKFSSMCYYGGNNLNYCVDCENSCSDCFGCVGLKHKKYCILNKQYTKEEYEELLPKIIEHMKQTGEWGEFFPTSMSPFAYNETVAQEYYPLTKAEALKKGYRWKDEVVNKKHEALQKEFDWKRVPDDIKDVEDSILNQILFCQRSQKPYKIQKAELKFYRKMNLPIPRLHPDERHKDRMKLRNPRKLWTRNCADCGKEIQTTFAPDRPEKILCEACYLKVVD